MSWKCPKCDAEGVNPRDHLVKEHADDEFEIRGTSS